MTPRTQLRLPITVAANTSLVTVDTARAILGVDAETIVALCQSGQLRWAFDLRARGDGDLANLRIWGECIGARQRMEPQPAGSDTEVLDLIVGFSAADSIAAGHLAQRFSVHRATVMRWVRAGEVSGSMTGHVLRIRRADVVQLLRTRRFS